MSVYQQRAGSRFTVDLGSVKLPAVVEKQVETEIRGVVLRALGTTEFGGRSRLPESIFDTFPGRTLGLWLDPDAPFPQPDGPLSPRDHTLIMREVMSHPVEIVRALRLSRGDPKPSGAEVLEAALDVDDIDGYTKERIKAVLEILPQLEEAQSKLPRTVRRSVTGLVEDRLSGQPLVEQVRLLRDATVRQEVADVHDEAMEAAAQILEDGADSIYSPDFSFHRTLRSGTARAAQKDTVDGVKDADAIGATGGGFAGTVIPGVGTAAGAAAGGAGASAGYAIGAFIGWLFD